MRSYIYDGQVTHYKISETGELYNTLTKTYPKGYVTKLGYRVYYFSFNGIKKNLYAHRMVAETYIPNDDPEKDCVNHIDGNKLNNSVQNLEWVTKADDNRHAVKNNLNNRKKKVYCYDKNRKLVCVYESLTAAAMATGFGENSIADCALAIKKPLTHGYFWNYVDDNTFEEVKKDNRHTKPVGRYDLQGNLLETYYSISEASQLTHSPRNRISDCAKGKISSYKGFIWKFL